MIQKFETETPTNLDALDIFFSILSRFQKNYTLSALWCTGSAGFLICPFSHEIKILVVVEPEHSPERRSSVYGAKKLDPMTLAFVWMFQETRKRLVAWDRLGCVIVIL